MAVLGGGRFRRVFSQSLKEAPAGFATPTLNNNPGSQSVSNGMPEPNGDTFARDQAQFEEAEGVDTGMGPVFNAQSCVACHQNPVTGGSSQVTTLRAGHRDQNGNFVNPTIYINGGRDKIEGRSLINDRAICPQAQEHVPDSENIRTFRMSPSTLGDGFVEAIDDTTLLSFAAQQRALTNGEIAGEAILVPVLEAPGTVRVGRFGWKDQQASLLSFASDAYINEMGISNKYAPHDTTTVCKTTPDVEDHTDQIGMYDIDHFAAFMRGTMVPPRLAAAVASPQILAGEQVFNQVGCSLCHVSKIITAAPGTPMNGGTFVIPEALGNKIIHPFSDFLLHDVGTGDGIVQNGPQDTANKLRTAPLWGLRTRDRYMHDGKSTTKSDAILRHRGEATGVLRRYLALTPEQRRTLLQFLDTL